MGLEAAREDPEISGQGRFAAVDGGTQGRGSKPFRRAGWHDWHPLEPTGEQLLGELQERQNPWFRIKAEDQQPQP